MRSTEEINSLLKTWESFDLNDSEKSELGALKANPKQAFENFYKNLEFGTAGIRGIVGLGTNRLNRFNIRKATRALAEVSKNQSEFKARAVISYDSRLSSLELVKEATQVLLAMNFSVFIAKVPTATPILSYCVRYLKCDLGIMMTASHNPLDYNGFKAYLNDGKQIVPPFDAQVISKFNQLRANEVPIVELDHFESDSRVQYIDESVYESYYQNIIESMPRPEILNNSEYTATYTPLHGTGGFSARALTEKLNFKGLKIVPEQEEPNGNFPTTDFPNPEDPKSLKMVVELMHKENADIAIGSDPDTDRMGVAVNLGDNQTYFLNGNEIANLMLFYKLRSLKEKKSLSKDSYVVSTIVSSPLQVKLAKDFGVKMKKSLTGFRWICDEMEDNHHFVFASEESYGSLTHNSIRDKDGLSSMALFIELGIYFKSQGLEILDALKLMYETHGFYREGLLNIIYKGSEGSQKIQRIMETLRENGLQLPEVKITNKIDYLGEQGLSQKSNVLSFFYGDDLVIHARPSGTEPKIKFYLQTKSPEIDIKKADDRIEDLKKKIEGICAEI